MSRSATSSGARGPVIGFQVKEFSELDLHNEEHEDLWDGPRFDVPLLGLTDASPAEVCLAAKAFLNGKPTLNRIYFAAAMQSAGEGELDEAADFWRKALECGDSMAHHGLGYTLHELGRYQEAYRHLRAYTEITPHNSWAWCWLGYTCTAMNDLGEARLAYQRAVELEEEDGDVTDAGEWLERLDGAKR